MDDLNVGDNLDQYRVTDVLARSGMATLYRAQDDESGRSVVLKVPHVQFESDVVFFERFRREEAIGQRLDHPAIVKVYTPRDKSRMYMALELVEGRSLRSMMTAPLPRDYALELACELCQALDYMHENGVVHRDLKPENIIIGEGGKPKIIDFGLALAKAARRVTWTRLSETFGTPDYIAPERLGGRRGDARSDVYALGVMLFEMLTGKLPFEADHPQAILRAKTADAPKAPSYYVPDFDPALEQIILRAIAREPRDRYPSARALLDDLRNPSAATAPASESRLPRRFVRPLILALIVAGLSSLIWISAR
jgi:eukaryotic-like serine/threonine-protein kinase